MTTPHDKALEAFTDYFVRNYPGPDTVIFDPKWHAPKLFNAVMKAIEAAGGLVCAREPVGAWYEDSTGCFHMSLNVELEEKKARENGHQIHYFHEPIEAGNGGDGWLDIASAPKDGTKIDLWGINLLHYAKKGERIVDVSWGPVRNWMGQERDDWQHGRGEDFQPTHWRPLPAHPSIPSSEGREKA